MEEFAVGGAPSAGRFGGFDAKTQGSRAQTVKQDTWSGI